MSIIDNAINALRFKDTIILKNNTSLEDKYNALNILHKEYPNNKELLNELFIVKKGLDGENEIQYQLEKANIGMYVLRDINIEYENLKAQIDYIVITPLYIYYIECKNLIGNITINDHGDFIREYTIDGKKIKKGMYSPLRQVEAQREVSRKIWESRASKLQKFFASSHFNEYRRVLVVAANHDTILDTKHAPKEIKYQILRSDGLVRQLQYDYDHRDKEMPLDNKKKLEESAEAFLSLNNNEIVDYYSYYEKKFNLKELKCPKCGSSLIKREGKFGPFYGCSNFPKCKYTKKISE